MFSETETRTLCESRPGMIAITDDIRSRCPARIFQHILENRARRMGFKPAPKEITDADRRAAAARTGALIAEDKAQHDRFVSIFQESF